MGSALHSFRAVIEAPDPPCDAYSCRLRERCAAERLACPAFAHYVADGRARNPYLVVASRGRPTKDACTARDPEPTRYLYEQVTADWGRGVVACAASLPTPVKTTANP